MKEPKTIVLVGASTVSWEDAVRQVLRQVTQSVRGVQQMDVVHQCVKVLDDQITEFRVTLHVHLAGESVEP